MDQKNSESTSEPFRNSSENNQNVSEKISADFGNVPNAFPKKKRTKDHTLTVREVTHIFEEQGLSVTERTVTNWCKPNAKGICRLDCFYEENDYRYYVTPHSVEQVLKEERNRLQKYTQPTWQPSETFSAPSESQAQNFGTVPTPSENVTPNFPNDLPASESLWKNSEVASEPAAAASESTAPKTETREHRSQQQESGSHLWELEAKIVELKIQNKVKDFFIEQLKYDRETFRKEVAQERDQLIKLLSERDRLIGEQKEKLLQLEAPRQHQSIRDVQAEIEYPPNYGNVPNDFPKEGEGQQA